MNVCPVLVGREEELRLLLECVDPGGVVLVGGEAGIGKTRLLRELGDRLEGEGRRVLWGRPEAVGGPGPYSLILDLLENIAFAGWPSEVSAERADTVRQLTSPTSLQLEPPARQIAARLRGILAYGGEAAVVLVEDLHEADELSHAVLVHLARSAPDDGVLLVGTYRTEEAQAGPFARLLDLLTRDRIVTHIELRPLGSRDVAEMLRAMSDAEPSSDELELIERMGEGVPFFVEELANAQRDAAFTIPKSISRSVEMRLQKLDEPGQALIRAASLTTGPIDPATVAEAAGVNERDVARSLVEAVRVGLLADQEGRLAFRHALVREAVAASLLSIEAQQLHLSLARTIESSDRHPQDSYLSALAHHYGEGGNREKAVHYLLLAGDRALSVGALDEARSSFSEARALASTDNEMGRVQAGLGEVHIRTREFDEASKRFQEAVVRFKEAGEVIRAAEALLRLSWLEYTGAGAAAVPAALDDAIVLLKGVRGGERIRVRAILEKGHLLARQLADPSGEELLREGLRQAEELEDRALLAEAYMSLAWSAETRGDISEADQHGDIAARLAVESGDVEVVGKTLPNEALRQTLHGRCEASLRLLDQARDALVRMGSHHLASLDHLRAWVLWRAGRPAEAERYAGRLEATRWAGQYGRVVRAWAAIERGDEELARAVVDSWWQELGDDEYRAGVALRLRELPGQVVPEVFATLAELIVDVRTQTHVDDRKLRVGLAYYEFCRGAAFDTPSMTALLYARLLIKSMRLDEAEQLLQEIDAMLAGREYLLQEASALEVRAILSWERDEKELAIDQIESAIELLDRCSNSADLARCSRLSTEFLLQLGRGFDIQRLSRAREVATASGAIAEAHRIESLMRSLGLRPRAGRPKGSGRREEADGLSAREEEVVALVAAGASNAEIGARLFLSQKTVENHISRVLRRLGLSGRASLAAWAVKRGLV